MIVHVYSVCHNEEEMLPYFLRHYSRIADRIVIYDDNSTDRSAEIISGCPQATVIALEAVLSKHRNEYSERDLTKIRNVGYQESRGKADWVVVVDIDEFLYHTHLPMMLRRYWRNGITFPKLTGFDMVAGTFPTVDGQIYESIRTGFRNPMYDKRVLFRPDIDINYTVGCHSCMPSGRLVEPFRVDLKLLHFRFLGLKHFLKKYVTRQERLCQDGIENKLGTRLSVPGKWGEVDIFPSTEARLSDIYPKVLQDQTFETVVTGNVQGLRR